MRSSEFCSKIPRDCLVTENNSYYMKITRIKKSTKSKNKKLPLLKRVKITKEYHDLIKNYIDETNEYGFSKTLISYRSYLNFKNILKKDTNFFKTTTLNNEKYNQDSFSRDIMDRLLEHFYNKFISERY